MVFEIGKCYEHSSGEQLYVCGEVNTAAYGKCLIAETGKRKPNMVEKITRQKIKSPGISIYDTTRIVLSTSIF